MKFLEIGKLKLKNNLVLAPMVDVTDLPYRLLCRQGYGALSDNSRSAPHRPERPSSRPRSDLIANYSRVTRSHPPQKGQRNNSGCGLAYTEMIYVDAALHENSKTKKMMKTCDEDSPLGLQITGDGVEEFEEFVSRKELWEEYDLIDLNCGCPSIRVAKKSGAGSFLMNDPEKIASIVKVLKKTGKPVSVKVRLGFDKINVLEVARAVEEAGADAITVHARLATEGGRTRARWEWIGKVKESVKIPVIGNGDVRLGEDAAQMIAETKCDSVMIARAAIGDPLVFYRVLDFLGAHPPTLGRVGGENIKLTASVGSGDASVSGGNVGNIKENLRMFREYLKLQRKYYGDGVDLSKIKYVGGRFLKKMKGAAKLREEFHSLKRLKEIENFVRVKFKY